MSDNGHVTDVVGIVHETTDLVTLSDFFLMSAFFDVLVSGL